MSVEPAQRIALEILSAVRTGNIPTKYFTDDARWWWNGGLDLGIDEFNGVLAQLHTKMTDGVMVTPGLIMAQDDCVMIEATSDSLLKDGRRYNNRYIFLIHFVDGLVREVREYSDTAHVLATFDLGA